MAGVWTRVIEAYQYGGRTGLDLRVSMADGQDFALVIPERAAGPRAWTYPIRIVATPVAVAADVVCVPIWIVMDLAFSAGGELIE